MTDTHVPNDSLLWPAVIGDSLTPDLRGHLESCPVCQGRVDSLRGDVHAVLSARWSPAPGNETHAPSQPLPESIGEYTILQQLGSGGEADVYCARHPRLNTEVVVKWYHPRAFPEAQSSQLTSEVGILSTIRHPYLAQVFDVGVAEERLYIIMEYVSGCTFLNWVQEAAPTVRQMASVLAKAARALDAVHQHGALHLDLKPSNILVDSQGDPRVIDFGMARISGPGARQSLLLAPGTPEYMSPEQCVGDLDRISVAADVYGLGAVLFAALSGQSIRSDNKMQIEPDWSLIRQAPWRLQRICRQALAFRPEDRFDSSAALAEALDRFATFHSRVRRLVAVATTVAVICLCAVGFQHWTAPPPAQLQIETSRQFVRSGRMVYETTCAAILHNPQTPCLVVATATSQPFLIPHLKHERAKGQRTATLGGDLSTLEFMESAGPHLILACAQPDWERTAPPQRLRDLLESLHRLSLKHSVEILVNEREVSLAPIENRESSPEELDDRQAALALVAELKSVLDQALPYYSGIVVIPSAPASGDR